MRPSARMLAEAMNGFRTMATLTLSLSRYSWAGEVSGRVRRRARSIHEIFHLM
jgi:hypothetical protein